MTFPFDKYSFLMLLVYLWWAPSYWFPINAFEREKLFQCMTFAQYLIHKDKYIQNFIYELLVISKQHPLKFCWGNSEVLALLIQLCSFLSYFNGYIWWSLCHRHWYLNRSFSNFCSQLYVEVYCTGDNIWIKKKENIQVFFETVLTLFLIQW